MDKPAFQNCVCVFTIVMSALTKTNQSLFFDSLMNLVLLLLIEQP